MANPPELSSTSAELLSWQQQRPLALCDNDECPWKFSGTADSVALFTVQRKALDHVEETGHVVTVFNELRRKVTPVAASLRSGQSTEVPAPAHNDRAMEAEDA